jgi:hypothetical protein
MISVVKDQSLGEHEVGPMPLHQEPIWLTQLERQLFNDLMVVLRGTP